MSLLRTRCRYPGHPGPRHPKQADSQAAAGLALRTEGVARLNGCVPAAACAELKEHALRLRRQAAEGGGPRPTGPPRHIPGSRIAIETPMDVGFADRRGDVLLPVEGPEPATLTPLP